MLRDTLAAAARRLAEAGIDSARLDARALMAFATGRDATALIAGSARPLAPAEASRFDAVLARRLEREPLAQIVGTREFWSLPFAVSADVLTPRPESETVIEAVLANRPGRGVPARFLDLGTGSGCLLLALLSEYPRAYGIGIDRSPCALALARSNARALGLDVRAGFVAGSWTDAFSGRFDVIVANPPYIESDAIAGLAPEIAAHEPRGALDGGPDGLDAYRTIVPALSGRLADGGIAVLEHGAGQEAAVAALASTAGLVLVERHADLAGLARVAVLARAGH